MSMPPPEAADPPHDLLQHNLAHCFPFLHTVGGVQAMLRGHREQDMAHGIRSRFVAFFERPLGTDQRCAGLGLKWHHPIRAARRRFKLWAEAAAPGTCVYHDFWGAAFLADLDRCERRLAAFHSSPPGVEHLLGGLTGLLDGVLCVSPAQAELATRSLSGLEPSRVVVLPNPVPWDACSAAQLPLRGRPLRLGYSGRLVRPMKRVDRLPGLYAALTTAGVPFELEILGMGPQEAWLRRRLRGAPNVRFQGTRHGAEYRAVISQWDAILFVSDTEGLPLTLLEGLSCGVLPIFPRIGGAGATYAERVTPRLLYSPDDFPAVVGILGWLRSLTEDELGGLRATGHRLVHPHLGAAYYRAFRQFIDQVRAQPRISAGQFARRPWWWSDLCPFALLWRLWLPGMYRATPRMDAVSSR